MKWNNNKRVWTVTEAEYKEMKREARYNKNKEVRAQIRDMMNRIEVK